MHELVQPRKILSSDTSCEFTSCMKSRKWHSRLCNSPRQTVRLALFHIRLKKRRNRGLDLLTTLPLHLHYSRKRLHLIVKIWITVENGGAIAGDSRRYTVVCSCIRSMSANKRQCGRQANADSEDSLDYPETKADLLSTADNTDVIYMCQKIKIALSDKKASVPVNLLLQQNALLHIGLSGHCAFLS
ncbi:hypothetical protein T10_10737 [Trichinella papuae]|uniref:Uncharacterized protein n=1 Tax=Trichinella papuae TaxID=268474 RepID=A0A0V1MQE5_9BILA|nr:hypothetical protein T10_10737 [Trichinella papuae]